VTTVFLLVLYLGRAQQESSMMFADINRCKYFAARVMKQPANPQTKQSKALSLIAYNFGPGNANKYLKGEKTLPEETVNYVKNILGVDVKKNLDSDSKLAKESVDEKVSKMGAAEIRKANREKLVKRKTGGMVYRNYYSYEPRDI
jgi:hypothetical protein